MVLIALASGEGSAKPVHKCSLARASAPHIYKSWKLWKTQTKNYTSSPPLDKSEWAFKGGLCIIVYHRVNVLKFLTLISIFSQIICQFSGMEFTKCCQNSTQGRPGSDCFFRSSLIWICTVCLCLFGEKLVFKILEHLW